MQDHLLYLYGGDQPWDSILWVTTDDRVRGGSSQSYLNVVNPERARFHGHLDTSTLGGAGFASQHSLGQLDWCLADYEGINIDVAGCTDGKRYALTLKDTLLPPRDDGRERSGVSWEADFVPDGPGNVRLTWDDFKPTYRGRAKPDAEPLNLESIKRVGLMMRSFFAKQDGDFSLDIHSIAAWRTIHRDLDAVADEKQRQEDDDEEVEEEDLKANQVLQKGGEKKTSGSWRRALFCGML